jgi:7-cyano-7-deazaguanine synthase
MARGAWNKAIQPYFFDLSGIMQNFKSDLLLSGGEIPEGHYAGENMRKTVVPGRNLIFISIMAGLAESIGAQAIALGVHSGDHHIYPDCRPEFIHLARNTIRASSNNQISYLFTPFISLDKADILRIGYALHFPPPYDLTRTCYKNQEYSCGKCGSCVERLEAFDKIGRKDPIPYASDL